MYSVSRVFWPVAFQSIVSYNYYMEDLTDIVPTNTDAVQVVVVDETPWYRIDQEPWLWYNRFHDYYLPLGPGRSLPKAYEAMMLAEHHDEYVAKVNPRKRHTALSNWIAAAKEWDWRERAQYYDRAVYRDAQGYVDKARITLLSAADDAAHALRDALDNERLKVAAAKEILDRVGLPGTTNVGVGPADKFSADELSRAEEELAAWERKPHGK